MALGARAAVLGSREKDGHATLGTRQDADRPKSSDPLRCNPNHKKGHAIRALESKGPFLKFNFRCVESGG